MMNTFLQYCPAPVEESNWYNLVTLGVTLAGIIIAAIIALFAVRVQKESDERKEEERLTELEQFLFANIEMLYNPIGRQVTALLSLVRKLRDPINHDHAPDVFVTLDSKMLRETTYADLFKIFVQRRNADTTRLSNLFFELNAQIDYINAFKDDYKGTFQYYQEKYEKYEQEWNINFSGISKYRDSMATQYNINLRQNPNYRDPFLNAFDTAFMNFSRTENFREHSVAMEYLGQLKQLCNEQIGNVDGLRLLFLANDSMMAFENMEALKGFTSARLVDLARRLRRAEVNLKRIMNEYRSISILKRPNQNSWQMFKKIFRA